MKLPQIMNVDETIKFRVTKDFKEKIEKASREEGLNVSSFIRSKLIKIIK